MGEDGERGRLAGRFWTKGTRGATGNGNAAAGPARDAEGDAARDDGKVRESADAPASLACLSNILSLACLCEKAEHHRYREPLLLGRC